MKLTWETAAKMMAMVVRDGTDEGREKVCEEMLRMGQLIDQLQEPQETRPDRGPKNFTRSDTRGQLEAVWDVLAMAREDCIPEDSGGPHDDQWDEVCDAMLWIAKDLGIDMTDTHVVEA